MNLVLAITGATGSYAAELLLKKSPWPVALVASDWGRKVYARECGDFSRLTALAHAVYDDADLASAISSGSVPTVGMVVLPCSTNTLACVAHGLANTLITRAAHCHLKEKRKLVLAVRESPWTTIDLTNAATASAAGAVIMPLSPPFYHAAGRDPQSVSMHELLDLFVDRVLAVLGHPAPSNWETLS
jgi:flavin prenyltransferase